MSKLVKICKNGHIFKADDKRFECKCGEKLNFKFIEENKEIDLTNNIKEFKRGNLSFSDLNDPLPRLSWFGDIIGKNEICNRTGEKWSWDELELLEEVFNEYGVADVYTWKGIAENIFERSLYAIEHMVRIFAQGINLKEISL